MYIISRRYNISYFFLFFGLIKSSVASVIFGRSMCVRFFFHITLSQYKITQDLIQLTRVCSLSWYTTTFQSLPFCYFIFHSNCRTSSETAVSLYKYSNLIKQKFKTKNANCSVYNVTNRFPFANSTTWRRNVCEGKNILLFCFSTFSKIT